eukprot:gnl/TRDRNA2_/TRDRNA2_179977_c0_seq1.p1 gnl/TRDRNA2_/TRDRNA2_179977_c0~~gnl/TRDRNA2_/TRDRNA2_179977_c0_seq1.p1  ORF type:complete len:141 (+),score=23.01 gnl/TRDRNA2_/TRDRNA2_179977_c0_seq1:94-516(+)
MRATSVIILAMAAVVGAVKVGRVDNCAAEDSKHRLAVQQKLMAFGVVCEKMCRALGTYPNCQCPGFNGKPADDHDTRDCYDQYCHPSCFAGPNLPHDSNKGDGFMTCVKTRTAVGSLLSWNSIMGFLDVVGNPAIHNKTA